MSAIAIAVVATLGMLYIVSQFIRNSVGVIAPNLVTEIGLTPIELGLVSSVYFFVFAAMQLPLGVALDRFGPKRCMLVSIGFTVLGCVLFAVAHEAGSLVAALAILFIAPLLIIGAGWGRRRDIAIAEVAAILLNAAIGAAAVVIAVVIAVAVIAGGVIAPRHPTRLGRDGSGHHCGGSRGRQQD